MNWPPFFTLDLAEAGLLPDGWDRDLIALAGAPERQYLHPGVTSQQVPGEDWSYAVLPADIIRGSCDWLLQLYLGEMLDFAQRSFDRPLAPASRLRSSITLNIMAGTGATLDWHHDHNPVSGLFFVTAPAEGGGDLGFRSDDGEKLWLTPKAGTFVCFDASVDHCVTPLRSPALRLTVPMVYHATTTEQPPAYGVDVYLTETA